MPGGQPQFVFVGKVPFVFAAVLLLLFANTFLMLLLNFGGMRFVPKGALEMAHWYSDRSIAIQWIIMAGLAALLILYRKRIEYIGRK